jgi:hypothetical protein
MAFFLPILLKNLTLNRQKQQQRQKKYQTKPWRFYGMERNITFLPCLAKPMHFGS